MVRRSWRSRPENVSFDGEALRRAATGFTGTIDEVIYCGDHWRLHLTAAGRDGFIMKVPNKTAMAPPVPGQAATISWGQDDCKIVANEGA